MKLTDIAIKYRTAIVVLTLLLVGGGLYSYVSLPKESTPSIEIPNIVVTTIYPGASPDDIEAVVTQIIEKEVGAINGIDEMRSTSTEGVSTIVTEFTPDIDMDKAYQDVQNAVDVAEADLPDAVEDPIVSEIDISEFPIMTVNLASNYSLTRLKQVAEDLQDAMEGIPSVLEVDLLGGLEREVQVNVDLNALKGYGLTFSDLTATIQQENTNIPGGSIDVDRLNYLVRVDGQFDDPVSEIQNLVVDAPDGTPIYVKDVAEVVFGYKDRESYSRLQMRREEDAGGEVVAVSGERREVLPVISLNVKKRSGENIIETSSAVKQVIEGFTFPPGTQVLVTGDQSEDVESLVKDLENNIISGLIFVVAVLLFFLGVRNATLVGIAIPLSMFLSFIVFQAMGQTLNFIILFSLIIALGMLVDNAVVIVENIYRFREEGYSRFEAARLGTAEVGGAVVASTATTVAAFAPMLFWPGIIGEFMGYMPLTLIITLTSSLFVALIINPVITGIFVKLEHGEDDEAGGGWRTWPRAGRFAAAVGILMLGLMLGLANWKTLVVLVVGIPLLYFLHTRVFKPIGDRFSQHTLPRMVERYRTFLTSMLSRDYGEKHALLRNTAALTAFTLGALLCLAGGLVSAALGQIAGMILLAPGALLLLAGALGIIFHTFEIIYLGRRTSVVAGLILAGLMGAVLLLIYLGPRPLAPVTMLELMIGPALIVLVGMLGVAFAGDRERILLSDNRAALLNASLGTLFLIVGMFMVAPTGVTFFPESDPARVQVTLDGPLGTNIETSDRIAGSAMDRIQALLDENAASDANVKNVLVSVGVGGDAQFGGGAQRAERSQIALNMVDYAERKESSMTTLDRLRTQLQGLPGVDLEFTKSEQGPPTGAPVNIEISGPDFDRIVSISQEIRRRLVTAASAPASDSTAIPGLVDITDNLNTGRPQVEVDIDRENAARFGLSTAQIAQTVRSAIQGTEASTYRDGEDEYDITVRLQEADRQDLESLRNLTIPYEGQQIPLVAVADLREGTGYGSVTRLDEERVVTVSADVAPGYNGNAVLQQVQQLLAPYGEELPSDYQLEYTGENEEQQESFGFLFTALMVGVALIFMIMIAQFNSVSAPFIIMIAVGLSLIGVLLGLIVTRTPFSLFTFIGIISLAGIVVNNNIVLVDYIMQLRQRGLEKQAAIIEGGATRLRPVLLTAMTTVLGLVPLTFGINVDFVGLLTDLSPNFDIGSENTQFWGPMGTAIIAGLTFATFLTLVIVPAMYSAFDSVSRRLSPEDDAGLVPNTAREAATPASPDADGASGAAPRREEVRV